LPLPRAQFADYRFDRRASATSGSADAAIAAGPPSTSALRAAGSASAVAGDRLARHCRRRLPAERGLHERIAGPKRQQRLLEPGGKLGLLHVRVHRRAREQAELEAFETRIGELGVPLRARLLDLVTIADDRGGHAGEARRGEIGEREAFREGGQAGIGTGNLVPRGRVRLQPFGFAATFARSAASSSSFFAKMRGSSGLPAVPRGA